MPRNLATAALFIAGCTCDSPPDPRVRADGHYLAATSAYLKGHFAEAHEQFDAVRRLRPDDPRLPAAEGELLMSEGRIDDAIARFEEALKVDGRRATTWSRLGACRMLKGDVQRAQAALEKALQLNPTDVNALESLGDLAAREGALEVASARWLEASRAAPPGRQGELVLKTSKVLTGRGRPEAALKALRQAVDAGVSAPEVLSELADRLVTRGELEPAAALYARAAEGAKDPSLWDLSGEVQARLGHLDEAEEAFRRSLAVKDRALGHLGLARLCRTRRDEACVQREVDLALARASGEELREVLELAWALGEVGRPRDALRLLVPVSEEPDNLHNVELQQRTARLARELRDEAALAAACARLADAGVLDAGVGCP